MEGKRTKIKKISVIGWKQTLTSYMTKVQNISIYMTKIAIFFFKYEHEINEYDFLLPKRLSKRGLRILICGRNKK